MTQDDASTLTLPAAEGTSVFVHRWLPAKPRGVVVIAHGAAEHGARYDRFARALVAAGRAVYASDHRGHGHTAPGRLGIAGRDGWNGTLRDVIRVVALARAAHRGLPIVLFGHSMGSIVAHRLAPLRGDDFAGLVLSGTLDSVADLDALIAVAESAARAERDAPAELFAAMFASFNTDFEPAHTGFEWLSRDEAEVRKYVEHPMCGFPFSNGMLADVLTGWNVAWRPENEAKIPHALPVAMFAGASDPVGRRTQGVAALAARHRAIGVVDVAETYYPQARHEILNELNRDEVERDILGWIAARDRS